MYFYTSIHELGVAKSVTLHCCKSGGSLVQGSATEVTRLRLNQPPIFSCAAEHIKIWTWQGPTLSWVLQYTQHGWPARLQTTKKITETILVEVKCVCVRTCMYMSCICVPACVVPLMAMYTQNLFLVSFGALTSAISVDLWRRPDLPSEISLAHNFFWPTESYLSHHCVVQTTLPATVWVVPIWQEVCV